VLAKTAQQLLNRRFPGLDGVGAMAFEAVQRVGVDAGGASELFLIQTGQSPGGDQFVRLARKTRNGCKTGAKAVFRCPDRPERRADRCLR
jgi:hypothetical protein